MDRAGSLKACHFLESSEELKENRNRRIEKALTPVLFLGMMPLNQSRTGANHVETIYFLRYAQTTNAPQRNPQTHHRCIAGRTARLWRRIKRARQHFSVSSEP